MDSQIIKREKQKRKMKKEVIKKISLCNRLTLVSQELCHVKTLEILFRMVIQHKEKEYNNLLHLNSDNEQKLSLKYYPTISYTFNIISLHYNDAQVKVYIFNIDLNGFQINTFTMINIVKPFVCLPLCTTKHNINTMNYETLMIKDIKSKKEKNMFTNKEHENNNEIYLRHNNAICKIRNAATILNTHKMKIAKHMFLSFWWFQNIFVGYLLSVILKAKQSNIFNMIENNKFVIIKINQYCLLKLNVKLSSFEVSSIFTLQVHIFDLNLPATIKAKYFKFNTTSKVINNWLNNFKNQECIRQDKSSYVVYKNPKTYYSETGINTEQNIYEMESVSQNDIANDNNFEFINSTLWLPYLCGDCIDDKISNMSYILKCSCLNESLLDLDNIETYIREIANILTSVKFYTKAIKDLSKYLAFMLIKL